MDNLPKELPLIPLEYSCLDALHCRPVNDTDILGALKGQRDADQLILNKWIERAEQAEASSYLPMIPEGNECSALKADGLTHDCPFHGYVAGNFCTFPHFRDDYNELEGDIDHSLKGDWCPKYIEPKGDK